MEEIASDERRGNSQWLWHRWTHRKAGLEKPMDLLKSTLEIDLG